jgi:predicted nucleic acid-binding protein
MISALAKCSNLQVSVTGTVGIGLLAKRRGLIPLVRAFFDQLRNNGFWLSDGLCQQALRLAGE